MKVLKDTVQDKTQMKDLRDKVDYLKQKYEKDVSKLILELNSYKSALQNTVKKSSNVLQDSSAANMKNSSSSSNFMQYRPETYAADENQSFTQQMIRFKTDPSECG